MCVAHARRARRALKRMGSQAQSRAPRRQGCTCNADIVRLWSAATGASASALDYGARMTPMACHYAAPGGPCCERNTTLRAPC